MSLFHSAARNVSIVAGSHLVMWTATLLFTIAQAHLLGPARFGELSLAISYSIFLTVVIDFGLGVNLNRMVAQRTGGADALRATILLRTLLWLVTAPCLMLATFVLDYGAELKLAIFVMAVSVLFIGATTSIEAFLRGHEEFLLPSMGAIAYRISTALVGIALLLAGQSIVVVAGAFLAGAATNLGVLLFGSRGRSWIEPRVDLRLAAHIFRAAIPLGLWWIIATFAFSTDMVIMQLRAPAENVGWYAAALRLFNVATLFPSIAIGMVLSPVLSRLSLGPRAELRRVLEKTLGVLIVTGTAVALVLVLFSDDIIAAIYPSASYGAAGGALRLLAPRVAFLYVNSALLYAFIALHEERRLLTMAITFAILNPLANLLLIPVLQQNGAALVSSLTEVAWLVWFLAAIPRDLLTRASARLAVRSVLAAGAAAIAGILTFDRGLVVAMPVVLATYGATAFALGAIAPADARALLGGWRGRAPAEAPGPVALPGKEVA